MKTFLFLIIACTAISCLKRGSYYEYSTENIPIVEISIPDTAINLQHTQILARAMQTNGCWSNLHFLFNKVTDFDYTLEAVGTYTNTGALCSDIKVWADTIIDFLPTQTGIYKIYVFRQPPAIEIDTMIVKEN